MAVSFNLPLIMTPAGPQRVSTAALIQQLTALAESLSPGITSNLPGLLIEDITSTEAPGLALQDQARVDAVNSISPNGANAFVLLQQARALGFILGTPNNTSVIVFFTSNTPGYVIPAGFQITDGTNVYAIETGGVIGATNQSLALTAVSVAPGPFPVPANSVTQLVTQPPNNITLSVNNTVAGTPALTAENFSSFRFRVQQGMLAACTSGPRLIKTLLGNVPGVPSNLIATQAANGGIRAIVGGAGDVYQIAYALFSAVDNPTILQGSAISAMRNVTASIYDAPDTFPIQFVQSPAQAVTATVTWNTTQPNFTGGGAFASLTQAPMAAYINSLMPGQSINVLELNSIFQDAIQGVLDKTLLSRLVFNISINGTPTAQGAGTYLVTGDPESYFSTATAGTDFSIVQG